MLTEREKLLNEAEKQLEAERSEFQFMQQTVQPVKVTTLFALCTSWSINCGQIGLQHLAKKILDVQADLVDVSEIEWVMEQIQAKLSKIMDETRQVQTDHSVGGTTPSAAEKPTVSMASLIDTDSGKTPTWLMSPYNIRVPPLGREEDARKADDVSVPGTAQGYGRADDSYDDVDESSVEEDSDADVPTREELKKVAANLVHERTRKLKASRKKKKVAETSSS